MSANGQHPDPDRTWTIRALRGDITTSSAYNTIAITRYMVEHDGFGDTELVAALHDGDTTHPDDTDRFVPYQPAWERDDIDIDPETTTAFDDLVNHPDYIARYPSLWEPDDGQELDDDEPTPTEPATATDRLRAALLTTEAIRNLPPPDHLIAGYLNHNSLATLYGPSGSGKTFLALDWALHTTTGSWWHRNNTKPGPVLYIIAEGATGIGRRLQAWQTHNKIPRLHDFAPVTWIPHAINLAAQQDVDALQTVAVELAPTLIVIDTLARCTIGVEENSARDMGMVIANLDALRRATGACILTIHHTGKDLTNGARGSSALRAAMDTEIEVLGGETMVVKVTKQKDGPEPGPIWLARKPLDDSLVLVPASEGPQSEGLSPSAIEALEALRQIDTPGGVSKTDWKAAAGLQDRTFLRARTQLLEAQLVDNFGSEASPRYKASSDSPSDKISDSEAF